ncbi:hypothetical protein EKN06_02420 [Croceicoccus ponticola]|uniref:Phytoene synthase n=1 Tax=Croceicoccus ponticola TaxID=2217664 RepID=A0A437H0C7_9SPHN|nr:hypothetical protein EKN06_02420 [Croceicoccus ponticola]
MRAIYDDLNQSLPPPVRMAISHAPLRARELWTGFFALDRRFANILATGAEPMLAQMRLAWWRETLAQPAASRPAGEPLLAALTAWDSERLALAGLADGWEALIGDAPLDAAAFAALAGARAEAIAALVRICDAAELEIEASGRGYVWALHDIAAHLSDRTENDRVVALVRSAPATDGTAARLLRPVAILDALARRRGGGLGNFALALRIGLFGR